MQKKNSGGTITFKRTTIYKMAFFLPFLSTSLLSRRSFVTSSTSLASRHMKQTIYGNIVFLSTLTFNNSYIITFFQLIVKKKPPTTASADNAATVPTLLQQPVAQIHGSTTVCI
jgi:hypothetical protein